MVAYALALTSVRKIYSFMGVERGSIDAILVTELSRWGRSTQDVQTPDDLHGWKVSVPLRLV
jgi:hypothetical protein